MPRPRRRSGRCTALLLLLAVAIAPPGCRRDRSSDNKLAQTQEEEDESPGPGESPQPRMTRAETWNKGKPLDVTAAWYEVPDDSLAKRRADGEEFTAAHNRLPIGTLVEVTNRANGKKVRVRITDRGIHDRRVKLDLCKEAAEQLGIVGKGLARVRMQVVIELTGQPSDASPRASAP